MLKLQVSPSLFSSLRDRLSSREVNYIFPATELFSFALATPLEWEVENGAFRQNYCPFSGHESLKWAHARQFMERLVLVRVNARMRASAPLLLCLSTRSTWMSWAKGEERER